MLQAKVKQDYRQ